MENYFILKNIHIVLAIISVSTFSLRGILLIKQNTLYQHRLFRLSTPFVDTILLTLGIAMAVVIGNSIWSMHWFIIKLSLIFWYIVTGTLALNRLTVHRHKIKALILAWLCVVGVFYTAIAKPFFVTN